MKKAVREAFLPFTIPLEGVVKWLYPDAKGLVSIGIGNLVDDRRTQTPPESALSLPLVHFDGTPATRAEIAAEWLLVKNYPGAARMGHKSVEHVAHLRLTDEGLERLVWGKLDEMQAYLLRRFSDFEDWCADAQLATLSMSWACGPAFHFPKLEEALRQRDYMTAAKECFMPEEAQYSGLKPRNKANKILYTNAAYVQSYNFETSPYDENILYWPKELTGNEDKDEDTIVDFDIVRPKIDFDEKP